MGQGGLTPAAEMWNGRLAMLGLIAVVMASLATGKDILEVIDIGTGGLLRRQERARRRRPGGGGRRRRRRRRPRGVNAVKSVGLNAHYTAMRSADAVFAPPAPRGAARVVAAALPEPAAETSRTSATVAGRLPHRRSPYSIASWPRPHRASPR